MAREKNSVSAQTLFACVDFLADQMAKENNEEVDDNGEVITAALSADQIELEAYRFVKDTLESDNDKAAEQVIENGRKYLKAQEKAGKTKGTPGRHVAAEVLEVIRKDFNPILVQQFENGTLDKKTRTKILNAARQKVNLNKEAEASQAKSAAVVQAQAAE